MSAETETEYRPLSGQIISQKDVSPSIVWKAMSDSNLTTGAV